MGGSPKPIVRISTLPNSCSLKRYEPRAGNFYSQLLCGPHIFFFLLAINRVRSQPKRIDVYTTGCHLHCFFLMYCIPGVGIFFIFHSFLSLYLNSGIMVREIGDVFITQVYCVSTNYNEVTTRTTKSIILYEDFYDY